MLVLVFVLVSGAAVGEVELVVDEVGLEVDEVDPVDVVVEV